MIENAKSFEDEIDHKQKIIDPSYLLAKKIVNRSTEWSLMLWDQSFGRSTE